MTLVLVIAGAAIGSRALAFLGAGLCGAFTTYSTFAYETATLARAGSWRLALLNVTASAVGGIGALFAGVSLTAWFG